MRPPGEVRKALRAAAHALKAERQNATWKALAQRACVGLEVGRRTVQNMARAGELHRAGTVQVAGVCRPMVTYAPAAEPTAPAPLDQLARAWQA